MKTDFYDIYDYIYVPFWKTNTFIGIMIALISTVLLVAAYFFYVYWKKRSKEKKRINHWDWALQTLAELTPETYESKKAFKQFYFTMTEIMKQYLQKRFSLDVVEKTDEELVRYLKKEAAKRTEDIGATFISDLETVLQGSLFIKFANAQALQEQAKKDLETMCGLIKGTIPNESKTS